VPKDTLEFLELIEHIDSVKVIRIGTRLPIHSPRSFEAKLVGDLLKKIHKMAKERPFYILIHCNHPDELTKPVFNAIEMLKETGATLLSQSIFLKGVNDSVETLQKLFTTLHHHGVQPYYIYRCDYVHGLERFVCSLRAERKIMTELRKCLSGIAYPNYVVDVVGRGKIPVPLGFWKSKTRACVDFDGKIIKL
jgi:lysine 2,3-aminomutase